MSNRKRCPRCTQTFPRTPEWFHRHRSRPDGLSSYCRACSKAKERLRYDEQMANPDERRAYNQRQRENHRLRHERQTGSLELSKMQTTAQGAYRPPHFGNSEHPLVDVGPLRAWLQHTFRGWGTAEIANHLGEDDRHLWRILRQQERVSLYVADRILVAARRPDLVSTFYPLPEEE